MQNQQFFCQLYFMCIYYIYWFPFIQLTTGELLLSTYLVLVPTTIGQKTFFKKTDTASYIQEELEKWKFKLKSITFIDFLLFNWQSNCFVLKSFYPIRSIFFFICNPNIQSFPFIKRLNFWVTYEKRVDFRT